MALEFGEFRAGLRRSQRLAGEQFGGVKISITPDATQTAEVTELLEGIPNGIRTAMFRAINDTLRNGKTVIVKGLVEATTLKSRDIGKRITVQKATPSQLFGNVNMRFARFALRRFKHREDRRKKGWGTRASGTGIYVQVLKSGESLRFPNAFIATPRTAGGNSRGTNIYRRTTQGPGSDRLKLTTEKAINVADLFWSQPELGQSAVDRMNEQFGKNLLSRAEFILSRGARGANPAT